MREDLRMQYYRLVKEQAERFANRYQTYYDNCAANFADGCRCDDFSAYAYLEYSLYRYTGIRQHGENAVKALADMGRLSDLYLESAAIGERESAKSYTVRQAVLTSGRPLEAPMETMFCPTYYLLAYKGLSEEGLVTEEEKEYCKKAVFRSIKPLFAYTDWGPQNRGMIKGTNLMLAGTCFPQAKESGDCLKLGEVLCGESLGKWSVEDAQVYIPIWLNEIIVYQEICGKKDFYSSPVVKFYFDYLLNLMTPDGMMPEFGDGRFLNSAEACICCLEKGAVIYRDGRMRYGAEKMTGYLCERLIPYESTLNNVCFLASALIWSDESVEPEPFSMKSAEILDDMIGKKYRFCNGGEGDCGYLLFNYRDEGDYGRRVRSYMRSTLVVEKEKMHHGHSDENSIVLLTAGDSILLRDGGYREMDGGERLLEGSYRSDFYHNKLLVRRGKPESGMEFIDFCTKEPDYCKVRTDKIYFETFAHCDAARTRLVDKVHQAECDRTIVYDKDYNYYLVLDTVKALADGDYTFGPVFFGEELLKEGDTYYLTNHEVVCDQPIEKHFKNGEDYRLKLQFPQKEFHCGSQEIRRSYHQENGLYQIFSGYLKKDETVSMVTLLQPAKRDGSTKQVTVKEAVPVENGISVEISADCGKIVFAFRYELNAGHEEGIIKPDYQFGNTGIRYGELYTDALFSHIWKENGKTAYELISFTRAEYEGRLLWQVPASSLIQGDFTLAEGISEWNKWYGTVQNGEEEQN